MDRRILFKAIRLGGTNWVTGNLAQVPDIFGRIKSYIYYIVHGDDSNTIAPVWCDTNTVCEYTGLNIDEELIWEHDVLQIRYAGKDMLAEVVYQKGMFMLRLLGMEVLVPLQEYYKDATKMGNVFEMEEMKNV